MVLVSYSSTSGFGNLYKTLTSFPQITNEVSSALNQLKPEYINICDSMKTVGKYTGSTNATYLNFLKGIKSGSIELKEGQTYLQAYQAYLKALGGGFNAASLGAKALSASMKLLSTIGWMVIITIAMKAVSAFVGWIDDIAHAAERAKETAEEFSSSFKDMQKNQQSNTQTIAELNDEYQKLSSGVNALGNNVSLASDEYNRYHEITNQIADLMPDLVQGWDAQGNAILKVKGNLVDLNEEYKKKQQNEARKTYYSKDDDGDYKVDSVFDDYNNDVEDLNIKQKYLKYISEYGLDEAVAVSNGDYTSNTHASELNIDEIKELQSYIDDLDINIATTEDELESKMSTVADDLKVTTNELNAKHSEIAEAMISYATTTDDYWELDNNKKTQFSSFFNNLSTDFINDNFTDEDGKVSKTITEKFINNTITALNSNKDGINDAFNELFELDLKTMSPEEAKEKIDELLATICKTLGIDNTDDKGVNQLKLSLGFDTVDADAAKFRTKRKNFYWQEKDVSGHTKQEGIDRNTQVDNWIADKNVTTDELEKLEKDGYGATTSIDTLTKALQKYRKEISDKSTSSTVKLSTQKSEIEELRKEYQDATKLLEEEKSKAEKAKTDLNKTIYGNVDLDNRQELKWNDKTRKQYEDEIKSWGFKPEDMEGVSTVFGGSDNFDGLEIAFSPMLQTKNGAVLLDSNTVHEYIWGLIDKAGKDGKEWTSEDLFKLDTKGLEINGQKIKGLLADIGETAIKTGEDMHNHDAVQMAEDDIEKISNKIEKAKSKLAELKSQEFTNAWSALENTDDDTLKSAKKDLTDLADAGKLTVDEFKCIPGVEDYFKEIGLSAEEAVKKINDLTDNTKQLSTLKSAIGSIQDAYSEKKENGIVGADTLSKMETEFGSLGKAWDTYKKKAGSAKTSTAELKKAQNELATAYVNSNNFLSGLVSETGKCTEANKQYYISQLEELGIKNAEEVVNNEIIRQKANLIIENINLGTATKEEIDWLDAEINKLGLSKKALQQYRFYKQIASNTALDTSASVKNLIELAKKCGVAEKAIKRLQILLSTLNQIDYNKQLLEDSVIKNNPHASESIRKNIEEYNRIVKNIKKKSKKDALDYVDKVLTDDDTDLTIDPSNGNDKNSKDKSSKSKQTFDWIEKRLDHLANKTQKTIDKINNYIKQGTKNKYYTTLLNNIDDEIKANDKAAKKYQQKANTVTFSKNKAKDKAFKKKIRTGAIDGSYKKLIQDYGEKTANKIENYRNWYDKSENAKKTASQKRQEKREKTREALDSRIEDLNNQLDQIKNTADGYQHKIDLQEANGLTPTKKTYNNLITNAQDQISNLEAQNKELSNYQKGLKKNSVEWYDIQKQINENNSSIQDLTKSQAEWNAEIRKLPLNVIQSMIDLLDSAKSSFESLLNLKKQINKHISSKDVEKQINFEKENMQLSTSKIQELAKGDLNKALSEEGLNKSQKQLYANYLRQLGEGEIGEKQFFELINKLGISKEDYNRNTLLKDTTQSMLSEYSSWLESANNIDQTAESYIDTQIDKLQEERDLLKEINDAKSKSLELEKKQQKLQEAKQNKTNLIYHEGFGFNYEEDNTAVNEAQNELDDYNFELNQDQYDEAIKVLEEIRDKESYVTLDQDGNVLTPDWDNWVKKIVDSLNSKNFTFNLVQDSAGNITTTPKYAKGTKSAKGGMSIVGENGIEMRLLNQGDAILPHDVTENLWDFGLNPQQMIMDNLKLPDYSGLIKPRAVEQNKVVQIQNVTLPNINDLSKAQELFDGLMTINSDATQRAWKH